MWCCNAPAIKVVLCCVIHKQVVQIEILFSVLASIILGEFASAIRNADPNPEGMPNPVKAHWYPPESCIYLPAMGGPWSPWYEAHGSIFPLMFPLAEKYLVTFQGSEWGSWVHLFPAHQWFVWSIATDLYLKVHPQSANGALTLEIGGFLTGINMSHFNFPLQIHRLFHNIAPQPSVPFIFQSSKPRFP